MRIPGNAEKGGQTRTSNESPGREPPRDGRAHEPGASGREGTPRTITQASQSRRPEPEVAWATPTSVSRRGLVGGCAPLQPQAARWPLGAPESGHVPPPNPEGLGTHPAPLQTHQQGQSSDSSTAWRPQLLTPSSWTLSFQHEVCFFIIWDGNINIQIIAHIHKMLVSIMQ